MVVPAHVRAALTEGDIPTVEAYLDGGADINDVVEQDGLDTFLMTIPLLINEITEGHVALVKMLLRRGADVNCVPDLGEEGGGSDGYSALQCCLDALPYASFPAKKVIMEILRIYIDSGANVNYKDTSEEAPLGMALYMPFWYGVGEQPSAAFEAAKLLLRGWASLDGCREDEENEYRSTTAEQILRQAERGTELAHNEHFVACKALVADMRAAGGTWRHYVLHMPKELLRLRSLVARGRAREIKRLRARTPREVALFLSPTFPNELLWRVLEYWNPRYERAPRRRRGDPEPLVV